MPDTSVAHALQVIGRIRWVALGAGAVVAACGILSPAEGPFMALLLLVRMLALAVVGYAASAQYLTGRHPAGLGALEPGEGGRLSLYLQIDVLISLLSALALGMGRVVPAILGENSGFIALMCVLIALYLLLRGVARYGTVLPALVDGGDASLAAARARRTERPLLWRLAALVGLALMTAATLVLLPGAAIQTGGGVDGPAGLAIMAPVAAALDVFWATLFAVLLCRAYKGRYA